MRYKAELEQDHFQMTKVEEGQRDRKRECEREERPENEQAKEKKPMRLTALTLKRNVNSPSFLSMPYIRISVAVAKPPAPSISRPTTLSVFPMASGLHTVRVAMFGSSED